MLRLNKIFKRTYQDGTGAGLVDKERGVFRTNVCTYHKEKELVCPPAMVLVGEMKGGGNGDKGGPVGG